jgi:[protein-PII] uridylyltransferase
VIEINGRDRPGLLYTITNVLTKLSLQISSALVTTYGERAVDVFYVKDAFGMQVTHKGKLEQIRTALRKSLEDDGAGPIIIPHSEDSATAKRARRVSS